MPTLKFSIAPQYSHAISLITQPDGSMQNKDVNNFSLAPILTFSTPIPFTGGTLSISSNFNFYQYKNTNLWGLEQQTSLLQRLGINRSDYSWCSAIVSCKGNQPHADHAQLAHRLLHRWVWTTWQGQGRVWHVTAEEVGGSKCHSIQKLSKLLPSLSSDGREFNSIN